MKTRIATMIALIGLVFVPAAVRAAEPTTPGFVVRVQSIDNLLATAHYLADLAGKGEEAKQFEGLIRTQAGPDGLKGIDTKRPIGLYGSVGPSGIDSTVVVLVPIAEEKALLDLLGNFEIKPEKGADGVYSVNLPNVPFPVYFRFANKYAYITVREKDAIATDKLLKPEAVLPKDDIGVASLALRIDQIPDGLKQIALAQFESAINDAKDKKEPGETPAQHAIKVKTIEQLSKGIASVVNEGGEVGLRLEVDRKKHDLALEFSFAGKAKSKLAVSIADLGESKSLFGALMSNDAAVNGILHVAVPDEMKAAIASAVDEGFKEALAGEKDATKRAHAEQIMKVFGPSLKAGELDAGFSMRGPSKGGHYTIVGGIKIKDGGAVDKLLRDALKDVPAKEREQIKLDAESAGDVRIHRVDAQKSFDPEAKRLFGDNPIYFAIRDDAAVIAVGEDGLGALKEALAAKPKSAPPVHVQVSLARLAEAMAKDQKNAPAAAKKAFTEKDSDKITLTVTGGTALKIRIAMKSAVVKFIQLVDEGGN